MNMTTRNWVAGLLGLGLLLGVSRASAAELDVCHLYAEARYQETIAQSDDDHAADLAYGDAYDDCAAGEGHSLFARELEGRHEAYGEVRLADGSWRPTTTAEDWSADLDAAANMVDNGLVVDPWASSGEE